MVRPAVLAQYAMGKGDVRRCYRLSVGEPGLRVEVKGNLGAVFVDVDVFGNQAVERKGFVTIARHQALEHILAHEIDPLALDDERVEIVEAAGEGTPQRASLRRIRVHVGQVGEISRQLRITVHGDAVRRLSCCRRRT